MKASGLGKRLHKATMTRPMRDKHGLQLRGRGGGRTKKRGGYRK